MVRALAAAAAVAVVVVAVFSGRDEGARAQECFGIAPLEFDTHEVYDNAGLYLAAIELAAAGQVVTSSTTPLGSPHNLEYPGLIKGTREERLEGEADTTLRIPPTLLKAIVWVESEFEHANGNVPWGGVGSVSRSFDCGFGLGQITTGMVNYTGNPTPRQALVGTHFLFNLAEAARMLAKKWNADFVPVAGTGDPAALEDWYHALWAYNGLAALNHPLFERDRDFDWLDHPLYPWRDPLRGEVYHCEDELASSWVDAGDGRPLYIRGDYTYQERVYGCMRHPPAYPPRLYDDERYTPTFAPEVADPEPTPTATEEGEDGEEDSTEDPTATPVADNPEDGSSPDEGSADEREDAAQYEEPEWPGGIPRLWRPVHMNMPDLSIPAVAAAFAPSVFIVCEDTEFPDGCPGMDFPTSFPELGIETHRDLTAAAGPEILDRLLGAPRTAITALDEVSIAIDEEGVPGSVEISVTNTGTWIAPFRIVTTDSWILVRRKGGEGRVHGGVAIGAETTIMVCGAMYCGADITKQGHVAELEITLDMEQLPEGEDVHGIVLIEPLAGEGESRSIIVRAGPSVESTAVEEDEEVEATLDQRIVVPGLASDE